MRRALPLGFAAALALACSRPAALDERGLRLYGSAGGLVSWILGGPVVAERVFVPRAFSADLRCGSGPIRVEDLTGSVRARTRGSAIEVRAVDGDLELRSGSGAIAASEVRGEVEARTSGGSVRMAEVSGDLDARTAGGSIELRDVVGPVVARTSGGTVRVRFSRLPEGDLETSGGSVEAEIPGDAGVDLEATTSGGRVELSRDVAFDGSRERSSAVGRINGGGPRLRLHTSGGGVRVRTR